MKLLPARLLTVALLCFLLAPEAQAQSCAGGCNLVEWPAEDPVWSFCWVNAANSSGVNGSGLEIRNVTYRGREVLKRGHVPILNVEYGPGGCGCFRDWMDDEVVFQADGQVNSCFAQSTPGTVQTVCDVGGSGGDIGSFQGVSMEEFADKLVLSTQTAAGWYRYTMRWHFYLDGRIQPEFSFATVEASCVASTHKHHAYWRLDFDIEGAENDYVVESSNAAADLTLSNETERSWGNPTDAVAWTIFDASSGLGYRLDPGAADLALAIDDFSKLDAAFSRYNPNEISDNTFSCAIDLTGGSGTPIVNNENIENGDVVMWYRSGSRHLAGEIDTCERTGPMLTPVGDWGGDTGSTITVQATPSIDPVEIPPEGGSFGVNVSVTNTSSSSQTTDLWLTISNTDLGLEITRGPVAMTLDPGAVQSGSLTQMVPAVAGAGAYTYSVSTGVFPAATASDSFVFTKLAGVTGPDGQENWEALDSRTGAPMNEGTLLLDQVRRVPPAAAVPALFALDQNYPNPFNPETVIRYALKEDAQVSLSVYNTLGQEVRTLVNGFEAAGFRSVVWDGRDNLGQALPSGTYFYTLQAAGFEQSKMMILLQ